MNRSRTDRCVRRLALLLCLGQVPVASWATRPALPAGRGSTGSITSRMTVASTRMAAERPTPIIFISIMERVAKIANTEIITAAALVTTPAVSRTPRSTASLVVSPCWTCSRIRLTTKTW